MSTSCNANIIVKGVQLYRAYQRRIIPWIIKPDPYNIHAAHDEKKGKIPLNGF